MNQRQFSRYAAVLLLVVCGAGDQTLHTQVITAQSDLLPLNGPAPAVQFIGRTAAEPSGPIFAWSGTEIVARFSGTSVSVSLSDPGNYFEVHLDGVSLPVLIGSQGTTSYPIASGLKTGPHDLLLHRRTEAEFGDTQFLGLDLGPGGQLLPPPRPATRHVEIIGDSISTGYGDLGAGAHCTFTPQTEDHYLSYGAITARDVNAELFTIAYEGRGIYRNYDGSLTGTMLDLYGLTLPDDPDSPWRFSRWTADGVVVNLGTNDFAQGNPNQAAFTAAYLQLLRRVRAVYPRAYIFCALGPLLTNDYPPGQMALTTARKYITAIIQTVQAGGDGRIGYIEFPFPDPTDGWGCNYHPSLKTHAKMAAELTTTIRTALGW